MIAEMNHHIRNSLTPVSLSAHVTDDQQLIRVISEGWTGLTGLFEKYRPTQCRYEKSNGMGSGIFKHGGTDTNERPKDSLR